MIIDTTCSVVERKMKKTSEIPTIELNKGKDGSWVFTFSSSECTISNWPTTNTTGNNMPCVTWEYTIPKVIPEASHLTISTDNLHSISI